MAKRLTVDVTLRIDADNLRRLINEGDLVSEVWLERQGDVYALCSRRPKELTAEEWNEGWTNDGSNPVPPLDRSASSGKDAR